MLGNLARSGVLTYEEPCRRNRDEISDRIEERESCRLRQEQERHEADDHAEPYTRGESNKSLLAG